MKNKIKFALLIYSLGVVLSVGRLVNKGMIDNPESCEHVLITQAK